MLGGKKQKEATVCRRHGPKQGISGLGVWGGGGGDGGFAMAVPWRKCDHFVFRREGSRDGRMGMSMGMGMGV